MSTATATSPVFLEPTFGRAAKVWWALLWRAILFGGGGGALIGFIEGFVGALLGIPSGLIRALTMISGLMVGIPIGIWVVQRVLRKNFRQFRICLLPPSTPGIEKT